MAEIEPKTREEKLWNGENIKPLTREEMYIKHIFDKTQTIPDHPITRKEMLMEKAGEGGGGDITIKQLTATENRTYSEEGTAYSPVIVNVPDVPPVLDELTVTENGTYTPPSGTDGYNEVTVSVPLPSNAYLLKEIEDVAIASFNDGADLPMPILKVAIEPQQDLHGYDAPWVGGSGKNKFDATTLMANVNSSVQYVTITLKPNTTYTMSTSLGKIDNVCNLFFMLPNESASSSSNGVYSGLSISVTSGSDGQVKVGYRLPTDGTTVSQYLSKQYQIEEGSTATAWQSYSNECPILGWDECNVGVVGKNLVGSIIQGGWQANGQPTSALDRCRTEGYLYLKQGTYTISGWTTQQGKTIQCGYGLWESNTMDGSNVRTYDSGWKNVSQEMVLTEDTFVTISFRYTDNSNISLSDVTFQLEIGSETTYSPYNGSTYTIDLDGTRYGCTLDVLNGVLTINMVKKTLYDAWNVADSGAFYLDGKATDGNAGILNTDANVICNIYPKGKCVSATWGAAGNPKALCVQDLNGIRFIVYDTTFASLLDFNTFIAENGIEIVYELATPQTIQLTPTQVKSLLGQNNVWADTGDILEASYFAKEASA